MGHTECARRRYFTDEHRYAWFIRPKLLIGNLRFSTHENFHKFTLCLTPHIENVVRTLFAQLEPDKFPAPKTGSAGNIAQPGMGFPQFKAYRRRNQLTQQSLYIFFHLVLTLND
ncbi:hypothetical protein PG5_48500 [Pseudomonas sp. G5(2012)]|nr:hypothetical protein PG5_48500 [Pseudomonas sp. G5(2012)]